MNVFEDLIEELKEENLLEETVIGKNSDSAPASSAEDDVEDALQFRAPTGETMAEFESTPDFSADFDFQADESEAEEPFAEDSASEAKSVDFSFAGQPEDEVSEAKSDFEFVAPAPEIFVAPKAPVDEAEFYRRRAIDEVTSLQMVEHVFSGVEREQMRILPKPFNDITVKKALHDFLQVSKNSPTNENAQSEFKLMQETESWCSALSHRDKHLSVSALRRYCETTKPSLSDQAIVALARFYRNLPHTESVRSKFDMILTRLFTKEVEGERRELTFDRDEMVRQISELYADWASVPLYSVEDETELLLITVKFDDFLAEAQGAENFDELVKKDFYNRLRLFKESVGDNFYAPLVLASAVESNVLIGNRYVELLEKERQHTSAEAIESQYSFLLDQAISDATSKTLQLVELLKEKTEVVVPKKLDEPKETLNVPETKVEYKKPKQSRVGFFGISQWLVAALVCVILLSASLYFYVEYFSTRRVATSVQKVNIENSAFKDYLQTARINQETFIGVVNPAWEVINEDKKQEILGKLVNVGKEKGFTKVHLLNIQGETVGYASEAETKVINPGSI
ncbi:MAG TPA: hypothetical protein VF604_09415 [Pyrinomonadaceae bacterium]|jgi:hypothetical protein